jgi:hypothetical protein
MSNNIISFGEDCPLSERQRRELKQLRSDLKKLHLEYNDSLHIAGVVIRFINCMLPGIDIEDEEQAQTKAS